jgi:hypothetical protein
MSFDARCYELAEQFLPDDASLNDKEELAQQIQDTIETFLCVLDAEIDEVE